MRAKTGYTIVKGKSLYKRTFTIQSKRYAVYGRTTAECDQKEAEKRSELEIDNYNITFSRYFEIIERERALSVKKATLLNDRERFDRLTALHDRKIREITASDIRTLRSELAERLHSTTVNGTISFLKMLLEYAKRDKIITENPAEHIRALKRTEDSITKTSHRALSESEVRAFFGACETSYYKELFAFLLNTGMRAGEALALTWNDITPDVIRVTKTISRVSNTATEISTPKTRKSTRDIPLNPVIRELLEKQKQKLRALSIASLYIFPDTKGKSAVPHMINSIIDKMCKKAGIDHFSIHAFRDTFATYAIRSGVNPMTLRDILGHASINMTMDLYAQVLDDQKHREMQLVSFAV